MSELITNSKFISEPNTKVSNEEMISDNKLENLMSELKISPIEEDKLDYSKILYYSLVFNENEYEKILSLVFSKTDIYGIYNYTPEKEVKIIEEKEDHLKNVKKDFSKLIEKLALNDNFAIEYTKNIMYKLNEKFHTTMLYLGGKKDTKALELEPYVGKEINAKIISIGISDKFIVCGIELVDKSIPYYGNPIQHITIGIKKTESNKFKLFPKDSPTAFEEGCKIILDNPIEITGKLIKEMKQ